MDRHLVRYGGPFTPEIIKRDACRRGLSRPRIPAALRIHRRWSLTGVSVAPIARLPADDAEQLDDWATLARSCGWWWPDESVCVVVERPAVIDTEPVPGDSYEQQRLRQGGPSPVVYRDGWRPPIGSRPAARVVEGEDRNRWLHG